MDKRNFNTWQRIDNLKEVQTNYSGTYYTYNYAKTHFPLKSSTSEIFTGIHTVFIPEYLKVKRLSSGDIVCKLTKHSPSLKSEFRTQFGVFTSLNCGEFGGTLTTPNQSQISGNFQYVFDSGNFVYAIDSLNHMGIAHFRLLCFADASNYKCIYETNEEDGDIITSEWIDCKTYCIDSDNVYILISGEIVHSTEGWNGSRQSETRILKVIDTHVHEIFKTDDTFECVENMLFSDNKIYVGMDKTLAIINLATSDYKYYTFLTNADEENIRIATESNKSL